MSITEQQPDKVLEAQIEKVLKDQEKAPQMKVQSTGAIKLKDSLGRGGVKFNVLDTFGFIPEEMVIQKVAGRNNVIVVSAIVPQKVLLKEAQREKKKAEKGGKRE